MIKLYFPAINLYDTFECGQCFRWEQKGEKWAAVIDDEYVEVSKIDEYLIINSERPKEFWEEYFDYDYIISACPTSIERVIESGQGIRILKQNPWETLISFIISQNNNIPRIKGIISRLCENFGDVIARSEATKQSSDLYTFPTPSQLINKDLSNIRAGFREKYILAAAEKCAEMALVGDDAHIVPSSKDNLIRANPRHPRSNIPFLDAIAHLPTAELRQELMQIKGVGKKIADCVMLFAYHRLDVFPQDVWIIRIMKEQFGIEEKDIDEFAKTNFDNHAGYIQQYLYHYYRNVNPKS
ncbi:MAG: hypothetical protein FWE47_02840 [Oscillospiraceae bacterium]|nr:hypothetical protein [Oscillospiraceae bacterium]